ncbi:STAS domain-containing protein [Fictibacillus barbaricus]|uniref:RsbT antagonist protein RsbS n=1 Tax=Fictibacillus barbaricus TaxID=182136 RepID=A0ABU1TYX1_9BACL|nr:STAS domain-containing protein [Fictibacillus barbaricus]MDR7072420.1 rsbT antagonist protein RsbS [Fictibacillus barbaricus]
MNIPILKVNGYLLVSLQETLDDPSAIKLQEDLLHKIQSDNTTEVVIDLSFIHLLNSLIAKVLIDIIYMSYLMGAEVILTRVQPSVVISLNELGISMGNFSSSPDMEQRLDSLKWINGRIHH